MRVDDGTELIGCFKAANQISRNGGRHGEDHGVGGVDRRFVITEVQSRDFACRETHSPKPMPEPTGNVARTQESQGWLDKNLSQPVTRNQRPACTSSPRQCLARSPHRPTLRSPPADRC